MEILFLIMIFTIPIFLIFRVVVLWYWGIDKMLDKMDTTNKELKEINEKLNLFVNSLLSSKNNN